MAPVAWTALGLLATTLAALVGALLQITGRIDAVGRDLGARIDALDRRVDSQGRELGARIDALSACIDAQGARIDTHLERHAG